MYRLSGIKRENRKGPISLTINRRRVGIILRCASVQNIRKYAMEKILQIQEKNRRYYNCRRKEARKYKCGDWVAILKTQLSPGSKVQPIFLGPYRVTKVEPNNRHEVQRVGDGQGPKTTLTAADFMKPWIQDNPDKDDINEKNDNHVEVDDMKTMGLTKEYGFQDHRRGHKRNGMEIEAAPMVPPLQNMPTIPLGRPESLSGIVRMF